MTRPENCQRIHFSLDGDITLASRIPSTLPRSGDTASGTNPDGGEMALWRCEVTFRGVEWRVVEPWSQARSRQYVKDADLVIVVTEDLLNVMRTYGSEPNPN